MTKFGILKSKIENVLLESYKNDTFKDELKTFKKLVLENKNVSKIFYMYDELNFKKGLSESYSREYIHECITLYENAVNKILPADLKNLRESNAALATENQELKKQVDTLNEVITQAWFTDVEEKDKQIGYLLKKVRELSDPELKDDTEVTKTFMDAQTNPKDIEFDGDKLVDSVEEAASKLKSIKEHNNRFTKEIAFSTGIACPKCGSELMYVDQNLLLSSPPQRRVQCSKCNHIDYIFV